jgi:hypothetical protein
LTRAALIWIKSFCFLEDTQTLRRVLGRFAQRERKVPELCFEADCLASFTLSLKERVKEDSSVELTSFKDLLNNRINEYVVEVLAAFYGNLIVFVKECEIIVDRGHLDALKPFEGRYLFKKVFLKIRPKSKFLIIKLRQNSAIGSKFFDWIKTIGKKSLYLINQEIMRTFTNFKNGQAILQAALTQLVQYYHRFQKILAHNSFKHISARNEMLNIHHLMVEIEKYKPTY